MAVLRWMDSIDKWLFTLIHHSLANSFLDTLMLFFRNPPVWIPLHAFMLFWILRYHRQYALQFILLSLVTVAITDYVSASVIKPLAGRLRPCHCTELQPVIRGIISCGGVFGFPSTHASNHFGMAAFWFWSVKAINGQKWRWLWFWAALVCFAQVYVGLHYPFDVLAGAILGLATAWLTFAIFNIWAKPVKNNGETKQLAQNTVI
jgi:undecaprenyl-diphosphatase